MASDELAPALGPDRKYTLQSQTGLDREALPAMVRTLTCRGECQERDSSILCLNYFYSASQKDEQAGYMKIFSGAMQEVRNPRAHENEFDNDPERALELLSLANHLLEKAKIAKKKRKKTAANSK